MLPKALTKPVVTNARFIATVQLLAAHAPVLWLVLAVVLLVGFSVAGVWTTIRAFRLFREAQNIRLGMRGEQAVAEVLHKVADSRFRAFHDLPGDGDWNQGSPPPFQPQRAPEHVVIYDGKTLQFPAGYDADAVPQAERNARWSFYRAGSWSRVKAISMSRP
ncbi:MAG: hypothetical protein ABSH15_00225 [Verrucomicrobiota bacterium]